MCKIYLIVGMLILPFSISSAQTISEKNTRAMKEERLSAPGAIDDVKVIVSSAIDLAKGYLERAIEEEKSEKMRRIYLRMSEKFLHTIFRIEESGQGNCRLDRVGDMAMATIMYVIGMVNRIHVCTAVLFLSDDLTANAAQYIIHELAHIIGINNECHAEFVRYSIAELNGLEFFASAYDCSLGASPKKSTWPELSILPPLPREFYITARLFH